MEARLQEELTNEERFLFLNLAIKANTKFVKERFGIYRVASEMVFQPVSGRAERVLRWCVSLPPACVPVYGGSSSPAAYNYDARCLSIRISPCVRLYAVNLRAWMSALHAQVDTASSASTLPGSSTRCVGLAANGAGPRRCTAGMTRASVRTRDRRTEARTGPGLLCPRNGRT